MLENKLLKSNLIELERLALKWNKSHNLFAKTTQVEFYHRHIEDSLQIAEFLPDSGKCVITDFGSGGGFPAIVLAIYAAAYLPEAEFNLFESNSKKSSFLNFCKGYFKLDNVNIHNCRIEEHQGIKSDVITARAFADLKAIFQLSEKFLKSETKFVLHKGKTAEEEIKTAEEKFSFDRTLKPSITGDGNILIAKDVKSK